MHAFPLIILLAKSNFTEYISLQEFLLQQGHEGKAWCLDIGTRQSFGQTMSKQTGLGNNNYKKYL